MSLLRFKNAAVAFALVLIASAASAAVSRPYQDWRNGPVQWIMTSDEQRAWRNLANDQQASDFIDLFWARRDPTPGTEQNEFRTEFETRVAAADRQFAESGRRGAMTDRGRVAIVLGQPSLGGAQEAYTSNATNAAGAITGVGGSGRQMGARIEWEWTHEAAKKFGMPKAVVVFLQDPTTGRYRRDVQRTDFVTASAGAIKAALVNADLKEVPSWAMRGGLEPRSAAANVTPAPVAPRPAAPAPAPKVITEVTVPFPEEPKYEPAGLTRLTLTTADIYEIDTETKIDPFTKLRSLDAFKATDELGWAAQYCTASNNEPNVRFSLRITGSAAGEVIDRATEPDELVPDRIRALNGCYMLRGAVPLEGMSPGSYELHLLVDDRHALRKAFRIE